MGYKRTIIENNAHLQEIKEKFLSLAECGILYEEGKFKMEKISTECDDLPYAHILGSAVLFENEIHLMGGNDDGTAHYVLRDGVWRMESTLPYDFKSGSVVVHDGCIHILGSSNNKRKHYKWDGASWTSVSTLPYDCNLTSVIVYKDEIHMVGTNTNGSYYKHYKFNGVEWVSVSTLPQMCISGGCVVLNDEIHLLGGTTDTKMHYKWDGTEWSELSDLPYAFSYGCAVVYEGKIHILGSSDSTTYNNHYMWDEESDYWIQLDNLTKHLYQGSAVVKNGIHLLGGLNRSSRHQILFEKVYKIV